MAVDRSRGRPIRAIGYFLGLLQATVLGVLRADVVVWHFLHVPILDLIAIRVLRLLGTPVVLVVHDPVPQASLRGERWYLPAIDSATHLIVHGPRAAASLAQQLRGSSQRMSVCSLGSFRPREAVAASRASATLGIPAGEGTRFLLVIGNLKAGKGIDRLLSCLDSIDQAGYRLLIVGTPAPGQVVSANVQQAETAGRIDTLLRRYSDTEETAAFSLAAVVATTYESGFSSAVIANAQSFNRPTILTDVGDLASQAGPRDHILGPNWTCDDLFDALTRNSTALAGQSAGTTGQESWLEPWLAIASVIGSCASHRGK